MPRGRPRTRPLETDAPPADAASDAPTSSLDPVRIELIKRVYVASDPEFTPLTWLHHPNCPQYAPACEEHGCGAFIGKEVPALIDKGWWNDVPGDHP